MPGAPVADLGPDLGSWRMGGVGARRLGGNAIEWRGAMGVARGVAVGDGKLPGEIDDPIGRRFFADRRLYARVMHLLRIFSLHSIHLTFDLCPGRALPSQFTSFGATFALRLPAHAEPHATRQPARPRAPHDGFPVSAMNASQVYAGASASADRLPVESGAARLRCTPRRLLPSAQRPCRRAGNAPRNGCRVLR